MKINTVSEISVVSSAMTLVLSVLHEWSYFSFLGSEIIGLISFSDYFSLIILWLPATLLLGFSLVLYELFSRGAAVISVETLREKKPDREGDVKNRILRRFNTIFGAIFYGDIPRPVVLIGLFFIFILISFDKSPKLMLVGVLFAIGWAMFSARTFETKHFSGLFPKKIETLIVVIPAVIVLVASHGAWTAEKDLFATSGKYSIFFNEKKEESGVQLLRSIEKGVLIRFPEDGLIAFYPWGEITSIVKKRPLDLDERVWVCKVSETICDKVHESYELYDSQRKME